MRSNSSAVPLGRRWTVASQDPVLQEKVGGEHGLSPVTSQVLINRGIESAEAAETFLRPSLNHLHDPFRLRDMASATDRIRRALDNGERIVVFGDYDADGVTATALLLAVFRWLGRGVDFYIPDRLEEGYGLSPPAVTRLRSLKANLVITVDNGITAREAVAQAKALGMDVIVVDHHEIPEGSPLPEAVALLHPRLRGQEYPDPHLAGVGMAWKLALGLAVALGRVSDWREAARRLEALLDLVALGTVADVARLKGENRVLVALGLRQINRGRRPGMLALRQVAGYGDRTVEAGGVAFHLAPRINAGGRVGQAEVGVRLLTTVDRGEALGLAQQLDAWNRERQALEKKVLKEALEQVESTGLDGDGTCPVGSPTAQGATSNGALVLASEGWHPGVIGIVASRLVERFHRPSVLIAIKDGVGRGSARSIPGFHLCRGLAASEDLLMSFGGHAAAAGLTIETPQIPRLRERLASHVLETVGEEGLVPRIAIDARVEAGNLSMALVRELRHLAPFGMGNPEPILALSSLKATEARVVGSNHLRLRLRADCGTSLDAIGFRMGGWLEDSGFKTPNSELRTPNCLVDVAFALQEDTWRGNGGVRLVMKDIRPASEDAGLRTENIGLRTEC